jgi:aryl-alcohol dehydrogenase-like predicted oxidoreductase
MPLDHYVTLGRSGLRVSPLCLGAMTFGEDLGWGSSVEESQKIIDRFIELGGNFIDTANFYTKSHSEKIIGDHVGRHSARRDRLVLATKFSGNLYPGDPNGGGSSRKSIIGACEKAQPGVTSTIIGARRFAQLEDNLKAVDVQLTAEELSRLDALTKPKFGFPQNIQAMFPAIHNGGTTVNGIEAPPSGFVMERGNKPY